VTISFHSSNLLNALRNSTHTMFKFPIILLLLFFVDHVLAWRSRRLFQHLFADVEVEIENAITNNCSHIMQDYLHEHITIYGHQCVKMYSCIMANIPNYAKDNMASAAVLLGLTPFILASLGSNTTELALIASRRPILAILLVLGSPSVNPIRTFDYPNPAEDLQEGKRKLVLSRISDRKPHSIGNIIRVMIELALVMASVANLANLSWTLTLNTIAVTSCDSDMLVELWIGCAIFTHIFGVATFLTGSEMKYCDENKKHTSAWGWVREWLRAESSPSATHPRFTLSRRKQNKWFIFFSWLASTYTLTHIGFGVTVLSSLSFVGMSTIFKRVF
jgi:hypothetical protein